MKHGFGVAAVLACLVAGCATGVGSGDPIERDAIALRVAPNSSADALGNRIKRGGFEFVMLAAQQDSAWLASAASSAGLQMTRPGRIGETTYVFFGPKAVGDTTHTVNVPGGGQVRLHDALFQVDRRRMVDMIIARFEGVTDLSRGVRALLGYVGSDVSNSASLLLGIETPTQQFGDSVATLLRAAYSDTRECVSGSAVGTASAIRLFYGPEYRVRCERAEVFNEDGGPVSAQFVLP